MPIQFPDISSNGLCWWRIHLLMQVTQVWSLVWEDSLEKEMATCSSILAWKIPWTEEPGGLQSMGSQTVGHDWASTLSTDTCILSNIIKLFPIFIFLLYWFSPMGLVLFNESFTMKILCIIFSVVHTKFYHDHFCHCESSFVSSSNYPRFYCFKFYSDFFFTVNIFKHCSLIFIIFMNNIQELVENNDQVIYISKVPLVSNLQFSFIYVGLFNYSRQCCRIAI